MQMIRKAALILALSAAASGAALAQAAPPPAGLASPYGPSLTRAEVLADLALWKRAGVDRFWRGEETPDIYSREYKAAFAEYYRLRSGPEYQAEVQRQNALRR
ncbi:DUF4148 domain-containing protein [Achromobacter anxifer]|uniref:DUF4148 domain-containing protein n=1 Tax=Achromobacter anxifer TaxID=1287737 RepID=UPI0023F707BF|nr:DUF4148 domain-containing protein [Achromobacter anxifer]MDF8361181.1 DUF4148 domain-containing protein [Achromobacter anxifer]